MRQIKPGDFCYCSNGILGIVTTVEEDGTAKGIKLSKDELGSPWESKEPRLVASIDLNNGNFSFPTVLEPVMLPNKMIIKTPAFTDL